MPKRPGTPVFREAQKHILSKLEKKWVPSYLETPEYRARVGDLPEGSSKQSSNIVSYERVWL